MTQLRVITFRRTARFERDYKSASYDVQKAAIAVLETLQRNPAARVLRLHPLPNFGKPTIWKVDVNSNHSWQLTFEMEEGDVAKLCRLAKHSKIDADPRAE